MKKALHPGIWIGLVFLILMAGVFLVRNTAHTPGHNDATVIPTESSVHKININTADSDALQQIPGIGPSTADAIIAYRNANGPITDPGQLINIEGIGRKKLLSLLEYIYWEE